MFRGIIRLENVGLFHNAAPPTIKMGKVTLIYGENGRGKSSFAAILRSCSQNRPELIFRRRTIDQTGEPLVELAFDSGKVTFENGRWSKCISDLLVFDADFIDENIFTGQEITTSNRRGLYEFAIGDAVELKNRMDAATAASNQAGKNKTVVEKELLRHCSPYSISDFVGLNDDAEAEQKIEKLQKELESIVDNAKIQARESLVRLSVPNLDVSELFRVFRRSIPDVHADAEKIVLAHIESFGGSVVEDWIAQGQRFESGNDSCPFCGGALAGVELIKAYQSFFNESYSSLKQEVSNFSDQQIKHFIACVAQWHGIIEANKRRAVVWDGVINDQVPIFELDNILLKVNEVCELLAGIATKKKSHPLEIFGTDEEEDACNNLLSEIRTHVDVYCLGVDRLNNLFDAKKLSVQTADQQVIKNEIVRLQMVIRRYSPAMIDLVGEYDIACREAARCADEKKAEREKHDRAMTETLERYQSDINVVLHKLRAGFSIVEFAAPHAGGKEPRASYAIKLRGHTITALRREDLPDGPCVPYALSEGDKRTLALSFFVARLKAASCLRDITVVFDDPVTSLDENRRKQTIDELATLCSDCNQLVVLSHDPHFLNKLNSKIVSTGINSFILKIGYGVNDYSVFDGSCNLDVLCESTYFINYGIVSAYLKGEPSNTRMVAQALRTVVEGFYKLRYPGRIAEGDTFGKVIIEAKKLDVTNPLSHLSLIAEHLQEFNHYASQFHHDSNPGGYLSSKILEDELRHYARVAMDLIHSDGKKYALKSV